YRLIYLLSEKKLEILKQYIKDILQKGWIKLLKSFIGVLIFFTLKKNNRFYFYINYRGLNIIIIKNYYSLFLISKIIN
ncbi:hypothetical protein P170DRAFT_344342, partial [Aspergillus steynii IBT 23096]